MRIVVDVMGGDHGPEVIIDGARLALQSNARITELFLVGREDEIAAGSGRSLDRIDSLAERELAAERRSVGPRDYSN